jgi:hypothetical protein
VLSSGLGVLLGVGRVLLALGVVALAMMLRRSAMGFRRIFMVFGCLVVFVFGHVIPPIEFAWRLRTYCADVRSTVRGGQSATLFLA